MTARWWACAVAALPACMADAPDAPAISEVEQHAGSVCADGPTIEGIDVSRFQGAIDWAQVKASGVVFAWIQISRSLTDIDMKFDYNWPHAKAEGVLRGAYQRFHPGQDVIGQAEIFLNKLGPFQQGDLPPMLDVEDSDGLTGPQIAAAVQTWLDHVEPAVGVRPIIYTGFYFWRDSVGSADLSQYPLWIANYSATCPLVPDHWSKWTVHQYSSTVNVPGITANTTDVDKFNGTLEQLQALGTVIPCQVISAQGDVVDDSGPCFVRRGDPLQAEVAGYGSSLQWTSTTDAAQPTSYGVWKLDFAETGHYRVEVSTPAPYSQSRQAVYQVTHAGTTDRATLDQTKADGWQVLGEYDFAAGGDQAIRVDNNTGEPQAASTQLVFDAIRLTRLDGMPVDPGSGSGDPTNPPKHGGGCSAGGGRGGWLALPLGLAALVARRRRGRR